MLSVRQAEEYSPPEWKPACGLNPLFKFTRTGTSNRCDMHSSPYCKFRNGSMTAPQSIFFGNALNWAIGQRRGSKELLELNKGD